MGVYFSVRKPVGFHKQFFPSHKTKKLNKIEQLFLSYLEYQLQVSLTRYMDYRQLMQDYARVQR